MRQSYRKSTASNGFQSCRLSKGCFALRRFVCSVYRVIALLVLVLACAAVPVHAGEGRQIASVVQRGNFAYAYDAKGLQIFTISAGDGIAGFTQSTVSIKRGNFIHIYNEKGLQVSVIPGPRD